MTAEHPDIEIVPESADQVDQRDTIDFLGRQWHVAERVGLMPLLRFAHAAKSGLDSADVEGMAAMYDLLQQCIADEEWAAFEDFATRKRAGDEELLDFIQRVITLLSERPTKRPSDLSPGSQITSGKSEDGLSLRVKDRLERDGRPDLALVVLEAAENRAA